MYALIASLLLITCSLVITTAIEVPINRQVVTWSDDSRPGDWQQKRSRWQYFNVGRTLLALLSFVLLMVAVC